jgi:hypothetical protein
MRRTLIKIVSIALLLLSLAALDDITTGDQPHFYLEWIVVWLTVVWFLGLIAARITRQKGD